MSTRSLVLLVATILLATWVLTYSVWIYQPTPNTMEEQLRIVLLVFLAFVVAVQVGILARPSLSKLLDLEKGKAR